MILEWIPSPPTPHTHDDKRKRWQTVVSSLITQWWYNSQISLLITTKRTRPSMNSTWSHLRSSSKSGLSYERGFGVWPQTRIIAQFSLTMSISQHSASTEDPASEIQSSLGECPILCDPMNRSMPGLPIHHQLLEFTQTYVHRVGDAIQPSHLLSSSSPPAPKPSQHQGLLQWVNSSHEVAKLLEFQLQHQSFQWTPRTALL